MKLGIDIDDVLYPFKDQFRDFAEAYFEDIGDLEKSELPTIDQWNFHEKWGITKHELYQLFNRYISAGGYERGVPLRGARTYLRALAEDNEIILATARGSKSMPIEVRERLIASTAEWLKWYNIPYDGLFFTPNKGLLRIDVLLDDNVGNLQKAQDAGIRAIAYTQAWNSEWKGERVETWKEFYDLIRG